MPRPGEKNHDVWQDDQWVDRSGTNVWGFMTVDVERGMLFVPLGTPSPDFYGGDRKGSNLYGSSLVALDAATGQLKWYFQTTHHDNWDYDLTAAPALIETLRFERELPRGIRRPRDLLAGVRIECFQLIGPAGHPQHDQ